MDWGVIMQIKLVDVNKEKHHEINQNDEPIGLHSYIGF